MGQPVVHFEIIGRDPDALRRFYAELFGWSAELGDATTPAVSAPGSYGFMEARTSGINGGVGGGAGFEPHVLFYVGVPDVEAALLAAEALGATRRLGPEGTPGELMVGQFKDLEGNLVGVAGPR
jgi:predicted enzyme related to lactoylglutathione lyase